MQRTSATGPINRREWDQHINKMEENRIVKMVRENRPWSIIQDVSVQKRRRKPYQYE